MKAKIIYPNYGNSILQIPNSILKYCGLKALHSTSKVLDKYLESEYKNVVVMLFDGMGTDCLDKNINAKGSFLHANKKEDVLSVFPCTTTAATTSIKTGQSPLEHGWIGWSCYFDEIEKLVNIFINDDGTKSDGVPVASYNVANTYMPFVSIFDIIKTQAKGMSASNVSRFGDVKIKSLDELFDKTKILCNDDEKRYIYTYWNEPDAKMHRKGCYHNKVKETIADIDRRVEKFCNELEDTLVIVTADHGMIDCNLHTIDNYPKIKDCLRLPMAIEPRCISFYIEDGRIAEFKKLFIDEFDDKFNLYTKEEFINKKYLGDGEPNKKTYDFLGDIIAVAVDDIGIWHADGSSKIFKALHAGMTEKEMVVPLIIIKT